MTKEAFEKASKIMESINETEKKIPVLESRIERFNDYIGFMDGRVKPIEAYGKVYKKAEIKFHIDERVTDIDTRDIFDLVEENKKDFIDFLKKCQNNYKKKLEENKKTIEELNKEFEEIDSQKKEEVA